MGDKIIETKIIIVILFFHAVFNFLIYSETFGNVNKYSELWLLTTILSFCLLVVYMIKLEILRNRKDD